MPRDTRPVLLRIEVVNKTLTFNQTITCRSCQKAVKLSSWLEGSEMNASYMRFSIGKYCKIILTQWLESGQKLHLKER
jgi:hypothetical protein